MGKISVNLKNDILNHVFRGVEYEAPTTLYLALFTSSGEVTGGGYERRPISFGAPVNGVIRNDQEVMYPIATSDWGPIVTAGIFPTITGGTRMDTSTTSNVKVVEEDDLFVIPIGNFTIEVD